MARAKRLRNSGPKKAIALATLALQIEILIWAPVRSGNLLAIKLGENLGKTGCGDYRLHIPVNDVKNRVELNFTFTSRTAEMIDDFIHDFRPLLEGHGQSDYLFPRGQGAHRSPSHASSAIAAVMTREIGLRMTAHQFRHAAAAQILKNCPGDYEYVRRVLGHRTVVTTQRFYCALEAFQATKNFGDMIKQEVAKGGALSRKITRRAVRMAKKRA